MPGSTIHQPVTVAMSSCVLTTGGPGGPRSLRPCDGGDRRDGRSLGRACGGEAPRSLPIESTSPRELRLQQGQRQWQNPRGTPSGYRNHNIGKHPRFGKRMGPKRKRGEQRTSITRSVSRRRWWRPPDRSIVSPKTFRVASARTRTSLSSAISLAHNKVAPRKNRLSPTSGTYRSHDWPCPCPCSLARGIGTLYRIDAISRFRLTQSSWTGGRESVCVCGNFERVFACWLGRGSWRLFRLLCGSWWGRS